MIQFVIGVLFGVIVTTAVHEVRSTPKGSICIVESGESFWSRKKTQVPCPPAAASSTQR